MVDNVTADAGTGGAIFATDDIGGVHYPITKLTFGALDSQTIASSGNGTTDAGTQRVTLSSDGTGTVAVTSAGITTIAGAVAGTEMQVDVLTMPTVTVNAHAVTNAGTFATQVDGAALTALQLIDNPVAILGTDTYLEATTSGMIVGAVRRDADTTLVDTTNEIGPLQMDANGRLKVEVFSGETLPVSGTVTANPASGTITTVSTVTNLSQMGGVAISLNTGVRDTGTQRVTIATNDVVPVSQSGTWTVQPGNTANTTPWLVAGAAADDAAVSGNPVLNAGSSIQTDTTDPGAVTAENEVATLRTDMQRNLLVNITHPRLFRASADYAVAQTNATVQAAPGASLSLYITDVIISNGAVAGNITLLDGSGGAVLLEIYPAINGGVSHVFRNPLRLTANTLLAITSTTVTTHAVTVTGYIAP